MRVVEVFAAMSLDLARLANVTEESTTDEIS